MSPRRTATLATLLALALSAALAGPALAVPITIPGAPLTVYVDAFGQLQAKRDNGERNIFFNSLSNTGDAGFFLAFPDGSGSEDLDTKVFGFKPDAGPSGAFVDYEAISQADPTGSGTATDPLKQVTKYAVSPTEGTHLLEVTQTTTYVNGAQQFGVRWDVKNTTPGTPLKFKALTGADFYFDGSDRGTGIYTEGPPRFIGGTNADTGNSGGFAEVTGGTSPSPRWSHYQALAWGFADTDIWPKIANAADSTAATFDDSVNGEPVDNAGGVEWDQYLTTAIPAGATRSFELTVKNAVPALLQLTPSNAGSPRGVPINVTATAVNTEGVPYAGRTLKFEITGANPGGGTATLDANGQTTISDPGAAAGADTIVAFVDFNNDGVREPAEPQASSLATFVDQVAPSCTVKVSGDRPGGGGAGKPLKITVSCNESATVTVATTLSVPRKQAGKSTAAASKKKRKKKKPIKIKLKASTQVVAPGASVPVKIKISKKVRRKYAGRKVKATVTVTARDTSGNVKKVSRSRSIKLAKLKKKKAKKRG
jgi:hypothetical protein